MLGAARVAAIAPWGVAAAEVEVTVAMGNLVVVEGGNGGNPKNPTQDEGLAGEVAALRQAVLAFQSGGKG